MGLVCFKEGPQVVLGADPIEQRDEEEENEEVISEYPSQDENGKKISLNQFIMLRVLTLVNLRIQERVVMEK